MSGKRHRSHQIESICFALGSITCICGFFAKIALGESKMLNAQALADAYANHMRIVRAVTAGVPE